LSIVYNRSPSKRVCSPLSQVIYWLQKDKVATNRRIGVAMSTKARVTIEDLYHVPENGRAEIIEGEVAPKSPTHRGPNRAAGKIYASLDLYEQENQNGYAFTDNMAFIVAVETVMLRTARK
jgi:hypothetical protein